MRSPELRGQCHQLKPVPFLYGSNGLPNKGRKLSISSRGFLWNVPELSTVWSGCWNPECACSPAAEVGPLSLDSVCSSALLGPLAQRTQLPEFNPQPKMAVVPPATMWRWRVGLASPAHRPLGSDWNRWSPEALSSRRHGVLSFCSRALGVLSCLSEALMAATASDQVRLQGLCASAHLLPGPPGRARAAHPPPASSYTGVFLGLCQKFSRLDHFWLF